MTNKEKYKKAFSALQPSGKISLEAWEMEKKKKTYRLKHAIAACAAAAVALGSMTAAYAADIGGIQEKVNVWFHGKQAEANVTGDGKSGYRYSFTDENGNVHEGGAGGVAIDDSGNEVPLSAKEVMDQAVENVEVDKDGKVWLYYYDVKAEITSLFDKDGICRVAATYGGKTAYFEIDANSGMEDAATGTAYENYAFTMTTEKPADAGSYTAVN